VSQEIREKALDAAVRLGGPLKGVVEAAEAFAAFLGGAAAPKASAATSTLAPAAKSSAPALAATKPATTKVASGSATTASKPAKPASAAKKDEIDPDLKKMVGDKVNELLKANLRDQAVDLLASFEGATSATGIVKQGQEVVDAFMEQADALLTAAAEAGGIAD